MTASERFHINPETGRPNTCDDGAECEFGGDDFHYASKHDAEVAWKARQLERGILAYRSVMQARERAEEKRALDKIAGNAKGVSKSVVRTLVVKNISKYLANFVGILVAYAIASGQWLREDWIRRLLPMIATVVLVVLLAWFGYKLFKGSRKAARAVRSRRTGSRGRSTLKT